MEIRETSPFSEMHWQERKKLRGPMVCGYPELSGLLLGYSLWGVLQSSLKYVIESNIVSFIAMKLLDPAWEINHN